MTYKLPLFVAEISANHLGSLEIAKDLVVAAAEAGAGAVKFQTYTADTMTLNLESLKISSGHKLWGDEKLYNLYQRAHTPWEWHQELFDLCRSLGVIPFSTPFDLSAIEFLESINSPMYKIASLETSDHLLIKTVAETGKPIFISTGATTWKEIEELVEVVKKTGNENLTLLLCTSSYPANPVDANLRRLSLLKSHFGVNIGLSDHTLGIGVSTAAIALGAIVIEKHIILNRSDGGPDAAFSMQPQEFKSLVGAGNEAFQAIGDPEWRIDDSESESRRIRRSLYIVADVKKGDLITNQNLRAIRPGDGCSPKHLSELVGKYFKSDYELGTPMDISYASE